MIPFDFNFRKLPYLSHGVYPSFSSNETPKTMVLYFFESGYEKWTPREFDLGL